MLLTTTSKCIPGGAVPERWRRPSYAPVATASMEDEEVVVYLVAACGTSGLQAAACEAALNEIRALRRLRHVRQVIRPEEAVLIVCGAPAAPGDVAESISDALQRREQRGLVVTWSRRGSIERLHELTMQARCAARVATRVDPSRRVLGWEDLGSYKIVAAVATMAADDLLPGGLVALMQHDAGPRLVQTLRCFLDNGGDIKRTAEQLIVHRATLYHRLRRVEEIAGVDLRDGEDRLAMHLGLRLAALAPLPVDQAGAAEEQCCISTFVPSSLSLNCP